MSLRAKFAIWHLKRTVKSKPLHEIDPEILRANMDAYAPKKAPAGISIESVDAEGVRGEWHRHERSAPDRIILYLHGGGYVFGSPKSHRAATFALAEEARAQVFSLDYRLAPEHPFPAAVDDAVAAYQWLLAQSIDPNKLIIAGDSAGGGLALALTLAVKTRGLEGPAGLLLYSPWTDLAVTGASIDANEKTDAMFKAEYIRKGVGRVLNGADPKTPLASPLYGDVAGFPPSLIFASNDEVLLDDSIRMHERLSEAGALSTLVRESGLPHVWPIFVGDFPEARAAILRSATFIQERMGSAS
jgi:acetyl esterase/lipase